MQWLLIVLGVVVALAVAFYWLVFRLERRRREASRPVSALGDVRPDPIQAQLLFQELERRALAGGDDLPVVFEEILRLRELQPPEGPGSRRLERASAELLWFLALRHPDAIADQAVRSLVRVVGVWDAEDVARL